MKKSMSDADLEMFLRESREALEKFRSIWSRGMNVLPIQSELYRGMCSAGRKANDLHWKLRMEAEHRNWPNDKIDRLCTNISTFFN